MIIISQILPRVSEWSDFLSIDENKVQLINLLADHFLTSGTLQKVVYVTKGNQCIRSSLTGTDATEIAELFSLQREADPRIPLHVIYESSQSQSGICVVADDTDILVLLLFISPRCATELYIRHGVRNSKNGIQYHDVISLSNCLGPRICKVLPAFHALTGCDYTRPFFGRTKYGTFKKMLKSPKCADLLLTLTTTDVNMGEVVDYILHVVYGRKRSERTPGESRYAMLFVKSKGKRKRFTDTRRIVPDESSLKMKIKRAHCVTLGKLTLVL